MNTIKLDNKLELEIFLILFENPNGVNRNFLVNKIKKPRTTIYDNLVKLMNRKINSIPYVNKYYKHNNKNGRPITIFF
ncbi:MAG: hypothetical protein KGD57_08635, partial [Candidatus Lokiarchaeota archaeon]|nr:hypothetical protein [Candidatus Lokiarchaeota archaeon]